MIWKFLIASFLATGSAQAQEWEYLTTSDNGTVVSVDPTKVRELPPIEIRRPFPVRQIWVNWDFSKVRTQKARSGVTLSQFDCKSETMLVVSIVHYSPDGTVLKSDRESDFDFNYDPVVLGSVGYTIMEFACGRTALPR